MYCTFNKVDIKYITTTYDRSISSLNIILFLFFCTYQNLKKNLFLYIGHKLLLLRFECMYDEENDRTEKSLQIEYK